MKILIDIGHPAHIHYWRNFAKIMLSKGNEVLFTTRDKEITIELLKHYQFTFHNLCKPYKGLKNKVKGLITFNYKLLKIAMKFKPDIFLSAGSPYAAIVSSIMSKPHITLEDTFNFEQIRIYLPFTNIVLTGDYEHPDLGTKEVQYNGYQELAYLHPNYFTPDKTILEELGVKENEKYVVLRFVSWQATHDAGHKGILFQNKIKAVKEFEKYAKVFISSESVLPQELETYRIKIEPQRMHDAIAFASLLFGESATMASEAAVLATPAIYLDNIGRGYTNEEEKKYGFVFNYSESVPDQLKAIKKGVELLTTPNLKEEWQRRRQKMLADKIDVTAFMVWFIENYPESARVMKENPNYQDRFR